MSGRPNESLYSSREESIYSTHARRPPPAHPAPNNVGVVLLIAMLLAIVVAVSLVGPGLVDHVRHIAYCVSHSQEAVC